MCNNHLIEGFPKYYQTQISRKKGEMKPSYGVVIFVLLLVACAPSASQVQKVIAQTQAMWTSIPTNTPFPTFTPFPTYTAFSTYTQQPTIVVEVTRIVIVTPTSTAAPLHTPTITNTPTNTFTPTITPNATQTTETLLLAKLREDKVDGYYLVNIDIAPGIWRSTGTGNECYWSLTTQTGDIIDNHFGLAGGTAYIPATAFQVEFDSCGTWVFLSPP
jgi:hypothetical protein